MCQDSSGPQNHGTIPWKKVPPMNHLSLPSGPVISYLFALAQTSQDPSNRQRSEGQVLIASLSPCERWHSHLNSTKKLASWDFQVKLELKKTKIEIKRRSKLPDTAMETPQDDLCGNRRWLLACKFVLWWRMWWSNLWLTKPMRTTSGSGIARCPAMVWQSHLLPNIIEAKGQMNRSNQPGFWTYGRRRSMSMDLFWIAWIIRIISLESSYLLDGNLQKTASMMSRKCFVSEIPASIPPEHVFYEESRSLKPNISKNQFSRTYLRIPPNLHF